MKLNCLRIYKNSFDQSNLDLTSINQPNEQVALLIKYKEKWTPNETHRTVKKYIDLEQIGINALMKQRTKN